MKIIILILLSLISMSAHATINRLPYGTTYCISEYGSNFIIHWKQNFITVIVDGSYLYYKIIKEAKNDNESVLTARKDFPNGYVEIKLFSTMGGDYLRIRDKDTNQYNYQMTQLTCWSET